MWPEQTVPGREAADGVREGQGPEETGLARCTQGPALYPELRGQQRCYKSTSGVMGFMTL